jgi:hypothetical protein
MAPVTTGKEWKVQARAMTERARRAAAELARDVDERTGLVRATNERLDGLRAARDRAVERTAQTRTGRSAGHAVRRFGAVVARMPMLSLTSDVLAARHGVSELADLLREEPDDAMTAVWLLEALQRAERDRRHVRAVRTVVDPTTWVTRATLGTVATVGQEHAPFADRLARATYALACASLRDDPADDRAWHALARLHLHLDDPSGGRDLAALAALVGGAERAGSLATLARAELGLGDLWAADRAAAHAASLGDTIGHEVRAEVHQAALLVDDDPAVRRTRTTAIAALQELVRSEDRARYHGIHVDAAQVLRGTGRAQGRKVVRLGESGRDAAERVRNAVATTSGAAVAPGGAAAPGAGGPAAGAAVIDPAPGARP